MKDTDGLDIAAVMQTIGANARASASALAYASADTKAAALHAGADAIWSERSALSDANEKDLAFGRDKGISAAMMGPAPSDRGSDRRDG